MQARYARHPTSARETAHVRKPVSEIAPGGRQRTPTGPQGLIRESPWLPTSNLKTLTSRNRTPETLPSPPIRNHTTRLSRPLSSQTCELSRYSPDRASETWTRCSNRHSSSAAAVYRLPASAPLPFQHSPVY